MKEYIEDIIMEEFEEEEYAKEKLLFAKIKIKTSEKLDPYWIRSSNAETWAATYLGLLEAQKCSRAEREEFCRSYWKNSFVRKYYIDWCVKKKKYDLALQALDESLLLDKAYTGLVADYNEKKRTSICCREIKKPIGSSFGLWCLSIGSGI